MKVGFLGLLGLLFIGLKLGGLIDWSWFLVLLPIYIWPLFIVFISIVALICGAELTITKEKKE